MGISVGRKGKDEHLGTKGSVRRNRFVFLNSKEGIEHKTATGAKEIAGNAATLASIGALPKIGLAETNVAGEM